jgi:hypothetical protein
MVYSEYTSTGQMLENELKAQRTEVAADGKEISI